MTHAKHAEGKDTQGLHDCIHVCLQHLCTHLCLNIILSVYVWVNMPVAKTLQKHTVNIWRNIGLTGHFHCEGTGAFLFTCACILCVYICIEMYTCVCPIGSESPCLCLFSLPCTRMLITVNNSLHGRIMNHLCVTDHVLNTSTLHGPGWVHVLVKAWCGLLTRTDPHMCACIGGKSFAIAYVCGVKLDPATFTRLYLYDCRAVFIFLQHW